MLTIGVATSVWPVFRDRSRAMALWLLALTLAGVSIKAHYTQLMFAGCSLVVFYVTLFRFRLVPRTLGGFGAAAAISQIEDSQERRSPDPNGVGDQLSSPRLDPVISVTRLVHRW